MARAFLLVPPEMRMPHSASMRHWAVDYILAVLEKKDWSANRLAVEAGLSASTINRPLRDPDWPYDISPRTVSKVHAASGIDPAPYMPRHMAEPHDMYRAPRRETRADRTLSGLPAPEMREVNKIDMRVENGLLHLTATIDARGIATLRQKLDALEIVLQTD